jgi:ABC-2 type transport system ATP-binding protein
VTATTATSATPADSPVRVAGLQALPAPPVIEAVAVSRRFGARAALDEVSLAVERSQIHALLGPNGAGKTTLLRALTGLVVPDSGSVRIVGEDASRATRQTRAQTGFVPSGDRTFYLRLSGLENLLFFARLHGIRRREAAGRALEVLDRVGLGAAARQPVAAYSHGMQKRLSLGRALLTAPAALLVDEATHDLDPRASAGVRGIVEDLARQGAAVLWATQRIDEIRGFAHQVTLLGDGEVRFAGSVPALMARAEARDFVLRLDVPHGPGVAGALAAALGSAGDVAPLDGKHWRLSLGEDTVLGQAIAALTDSGVSVLACHRERSELEEAFMALSGEGAA